MTAAARDRLLVLLRHARAELSGSDRDRGLTVDGYADAQAVGAWLREQGIGIDEVLCSTATRTRQTAEGVWEGGCAQGEVHFDERIYNGSVDTLLQVVREADEDADVVMLIGHAPGVPALASLLADGDGSHQAHELLSQGFPTTGIAVLRYPGSWADLAYDGAALERFHVCRG